MHDPTQCQICLVRHCGHSDDCLSTIRKRGGSTRGWFDGSFGRTRDPSGDDKYNRAYDVGEAFEARMRAMREGVT